MHHGTPLITTICSSLVLAFFLGLLAHRLKLSPLIGYLIAGILVGPFTPGLVADQGLANELAEIGVILLMFGVGLHFSLRDLLAVRWIAIPGAIAQIAVATLLGMGLAALLGWTLFAGFIFGLALSVASTVVLLRALQERRLIETDRGRVAIGWLIVEDLVMVFALVLVPAVAAGQAGGGVQLGPVLLFTVGKVIAFIAFMLIVGRRVVPWALHQIAHSGSRELFRLSVLAIALGIAYGAAQLFGVSFALGAFFAGMILAESPLSQRAGEETLPLRDAFAVLFFVSVGMLFNPAILAGQPLALLATITIIVVGKSAAAYLIVRAFGRPPKTGLVIAASLAQIGEFSFILATLGTSLGVLPPEGRDLILAGAIASILLNPFVFRLIDRVTAEPEKKPAPDAPPPSAVTPAAAVEPPVILIGYGRVGARVGAGLRESGRRFTVVESEHDVEGVAEIDGAHVVIGNAASRDILEQAGVADASLLIVAIPAGFEAGQAIQKARAMNRALRIVARAHSDEEIEYLEGCGANRTIMGEDEIARRMVEDVTGEPSRTRTGPPSLAHG